MTPEVAAIVKAVQAVMQGEDPRLTARLMRAIREAIQSHTGGTGL